MARGKVVRELWYKEAVVYALNVATFMDGNGDGIGDFHGLTDRLDHIAGLGTDCIWLLPFHVSPDRDDGYDVVDYYSVDPRLGTLGDFVDFVHRARDRGLRVLIDLVVNHTSDQHPWFQAARRDPDSPYRDYYIWSEEKPPTADEGMVFPGVEESTWSWDEAAGAYYYHRFYNWQPDLNIWNPVVREEIRKIMGFWIELGVSGFRLDAAPFLVELKGDTRDVEDRFHYLQELREFLTWRRGDAILLAEANVPMDELSDYVGDGTKLQMVFNFFLNQHLFLALATGRAEPIVRALQAAPPMPHSFQFANFLRNHDELDLARLSQEERERIFSDFAPDPSARLYGRGIRRRLPPMLDGNEERLRLAYSLMLTLPGTPVVRYGDEIGMGDDLSLPERRSVRTVMQWSDEPNAGFSTAPAEELFRPAVDEGPFRYEEVNVEAQRRESDSLLNWMSRAIRTRKECPEFCWGELTVLETGHDSVLAHACTFEGGSVLAVHNLSDEPLTIQLDLEEVTHRQEEMRQFQPPPPAPYQTPWSHPMEPADDRVEDHAEDRAEHRVEDQAEDRVGDRAGDRVERERVEGERRGAPAERKQPGREAPAPAEGEDDVRRQAAAEERHVREAREASERERRRHARRAREEQRKLSLHMVDLLGDRRYMPVEDRTCEVELDAWGFRWLRLRRE